MRLRIVVASLAGLFATAAPAHAQGDPIMPLSEVRQGMKCTVYSVVRGTDVTTFQAEVIDVVGGEGGARILVKVSGAAIEGTGVGAGFSGSPIYCPDENRRLKNAGAISETIGDFGGRTVLATPIEAILATEVDPAAPGEPAAPAGARSLAAISVRGLSRRTFGALQSAGRRVGRTFLQGAPLPLRQDGSAPASPGFRPGSAVGIGLSSGDLGIGAIGTVAYVDGPRVWTLGHPFDGVGRRSLFLQDAYVASVINNPVQTPDFGGTYKLAGAMNDVGTVTNDGFSAVTGRLGGLPASIPVRVTAKDGDTGRVITSETRVADETDIDQPSGSSALSFIAPLAVTQAATSLFDSIPVRSAGEMCLQITVRERPAPIRLCNRYVSDGAATSIPAGGNLVGLRAGTDTFDALALIDAYRPAGLHVTEVAARVEVRRRRQEQAYIRSVRLPRRVRPGQRVTVRMKVKRVRGATETLRFPFRIPSPLGRGPRAIVFRGSDPDSAEDDLFGTLTIDLSGSDEEEDLVGPRTLKALVSEIKDLQRYDGIRVGGFGPRRRAFRDDDLRIGGRVATTVVVR